MSLETDISYVYEKAYSKAHYDETINGYIIKKEDYLPLNLTKKQLNILRKMCRYSKIKLEYYDYRLPCVEDEELFKEYQEIKKQIDANPNGKDIGDLEQRRIEIRNKIVLDNMRLVRAVIDKNFDGIQSMSNKEDIYQLGYEILFTLVDNHTIVIPRHFSLHLSGHLITDIMAKIFKLDTGIDIKHKKELDKLRKARKILLSTGEKVTNEDIAKKLGNDEENVEKLLQLENFLDCISLDEGLEQLDVDDKYSFLCNDSFEKELMRSSERDFIKKILFTLPSRQREVIMLAYGFKDGNCYNDTEISYIMGVSNARIGILRQKAIENLKKSIRVDYLKEIYCPTKSFESDFTEERRLKELEEILFCQIPKEQLFYYGDSLSEKYKIILSLYYGLENGEQYTLHSIAEMLNVSYVWVSSKKNLVNQHIRNKIMDEIRENPDDEVMFEDYINYLIKKYIINPGYKKQR